MLNRRHEEVKDYNIQVPELLLQQQQKTQDTFNMVLAVIAGISVGWWYWNYEYYAGFSFGTD